MISRILMQSFKNNKNLRENLPAHASFSNPLDILGDADEKRYFLAL
jgi:acyl-CoA synthetase (NDP forming)